ncbi:MULTISPECIES: DUF2513 domain-containing protein [Enterococcus]|uniref:DUF2513 domain-containing protein n=1 Tax=Enterococcus TaxID=1350 RepID=UPI000A3378A3|nr:MULTISPECIES: DUF2513 domain-containing protein [Enterococcus]EGP5427379.1 DUF2513 domain-containing protein [Enterococcus faecium]EGP5501263.1 DUF2513 domain-containing protein [Enterococcus faecium]EGP5527998.1 DUF2513 domain-containing protein [Enterococcus faecium]EGP5687059.1 DUF2513 domain-containing protein [Enterococcus faecium]EME8085754.1 DUF2513 domain-containing protein [Enterococcus faecium]
MELKPDLIRDILLYSETLPFRKSAFQNEINESSLREKYSQDEIIYAISRMGDDDAKLINGWVKYASDKPYMWCIGSPTYEGHQYLENIRDPKVWKVVKEKVSLVGTASISIMGQVALAYIQKQLGI